MTVNGISISLGWSIDGGVYGINSANGEVVDAAGLAELIGDSNGNADNPFSGPSGPGGGTGACTAKVLSAVNNHFGTSFTSANVGTGAYAPFQWPQVSGGTLNIDIFPQGQAGGISPGRYPVNWWTYIIGYGSTLHIQAGPGGLDSPSTLLFSSSEFTAHLDSAYPYNPIGLLVHGLKDVMGIGGHSPCP